MEGIQCPLCRLISIETNVKDGEMLTCPHCEHRFTVASFRKYFLYPCSNTREVMDLKNFELFIRDLDLIQQLEILKITLKEMQKTIK